MQAANLELKGAAAGEQEVKSECNSLRLALDAARLAVTNRDTECARLQQSLHASRAEMAELAAKHRCLPQQASCPTTTCHAIRGIAHVLERRCAVCVVLKWWGYMSSRSLGRLQTASC